MGSRLISKQNLFRSFPAGVYYSLGILLIALVSLSEPSICTIKKGYL